jgi:hypothetical protein
MKIRNYQIALFALSTGCAWSQTPAEAIAPFVGQQLILPGGGDEAKVKLKKLQLSRMTAGRMRSSPTPLFHRKVASTSCSNNQKGGFTQVPAGFGADTYRAILADLNGDGNLDLVLQFGSGSGVFLGDGTGAFTAGPGVSGPIAGGGVDMVADLNGDGIPDIAAKTSGTMAIYIGIGDGTYEAPFNIGTGPSPGDILVANLHGQSPKRGLPDIVAPDTSGGVMVLINETN